MISASIFFKAKQRHILAFTTQQAMLIAKEGLDEMTPIIGNIAKGIKKSLDDIDKN